MFGKNPVRDKDHGDGLTLSVQEIFYTIQGEGPASGIPALFIRLAGCNLRCWFCDTDFESNAKKMNLDEIMSRGVAKVRKHIHRRDMFHRYPIAVLTGGEPFRQNVIPLTKRLNDFGFEVHVETAGTLSLREMHHYFGRGNTWKNRVVVSPKTPKVNEEIDKLAWAYKYVLREGDPAPTDASVYEMRSTQNKEKIVGRLAVPGNLCQDIFISPMDEYDEEKNKRNLDYCSKMCMKYGYRISIQTHKLMGLP